MRSVCTGLALVLLMLSQAGCIPKAFQSKNTQSNVSRLPSGTPRPEQLVAYLNHNAHLVRSLETIGREGMYIDARQDGQTPVGLSGNLACQKSATPGAPANFRLVAHVLGKNEVDIGSNSQEFWYWIARAPQPYVFHCSYADFRAGKAQMPFPFQPEWIVEALGIAEYDPNRRYLVREARLTYDLIEETTAPNGQPVRKVTVFNRGEVRGRLPQVAGRVLQDAQGREICSAWVTEVQSDARTGAVLPRVVKLRWPMEKVELAMTLKDVRVNGDIRPERAAALFSRQSLNLPAYDLAQGRPDATSSGLIPAGGFTR
jgi:hypothetical protein